MLDNLREIDDGNLSKKQVDGKMLIPVLWEKPFYTFIICIFKWSNSLEAIFNINLLLPIPPKLS